MMRTVLLHCGHEKETIAATSIAVLFCHTCGHQEHIKSQGYQARCQNCRWSRYYGLHTDFSAKVFATKHALVNRHTVHVIDTGEPTHEPYVVTGTQQETLFDEPPF